MSGIVLFSIKTLMFLISLFLILLVLVQRGRGGGLAGALGGMGGQSAFGTKAGDLFTRVTIIVATVWILLCAGAVKYFKPSEENFSNNPGLSSGIQPGAGVPAATAAPQPADLQPVSPAVPADPAAPEAPATPAAPASPAGGS
jgi:preprotein translocase subunit SecG